ncbi:MAG: DUF1294 domain-containing protein [Clostridia bacterium]|nr:DUF1294 domain-containing protein [Clostridia bacterium]
MELYQIYAIYLIAISFITFIIYFIDKLKAKINAWRIPEKVLLTLSIIGGAFGGMLAMYTIRHKTKRWYFTVINVLGIILHIVGAVAVSIYL